MKKSSSHEASEKGHSLLITLAGSKNTERRLEFLSTLIKVADDKINRLDQSRQTNLNYALLIFAGLFSLGIGQENMVYKLAIAIAIIVLMCVFCLWDRRLHEISHGWRDSYKTFCDMSVEIINHPSTAVSFLRYSPESEKKAEWFSFQPVIFYFLVLGGVASCLIFLFVQ